MQAQEAAQTATTTVRPLITQAVDESRLTTLKGNTHPLARPEFDLGTAPGDLPMQRMLLVLKRSPDQETALRKLLDDQQDKASPNYHKWLTPETYGAQFGPTDSDLQIITAWLQSHGFQVGTTKGRTLLEFSGTAGQVQEAFHTTIHKYVVGAEQHWANASDPRIPTALTGAVAGVLTLHNFIKKPLLHVSAEPVAAQIRPGKKPEVTFSDGAHGIGPQDFATIYSSPVFGGGFNVTGSGITIGVVGRSNLFDGGGDIYDFHVDAFQFQSSSYIMNVILNGPDPGDLGGGEEAEATLDATWTGAVATEATVDLVVSATTNTTDGVDLSELYIIENNLADVMTESFGSCEYQATDAQIAGVGAMAEQATAQGISYFVSTGDNGAEGCDDPSASTATNPVSVNLLASTPFNVAVGGTVFNEGTQTSQYWTAAQSLGTALSYIPEDAWNDSCSTATCGGNANLSAGSGGASTGNVSNGGTFAGFAKPAWQAGATGIPNDGVRDLPDVSLTAASHDPYLLCIEGSCVPDSQGRFYIYFVWGTSASAPSFAGIMALVDQQMAITNPGQGPRQGQPNYVLYRLAASQNGSLSQCNGSGATTLPSSTCIFNDTTVGNNAVPGEVNYGSATAQYQAGVGYDLATGLGSVNVANLIAQWNSVSFSPTTTTLRLTPVLNIVHGSSVAVNVAVAPNSGTGTPSGDVSLLAATGATSTLQSQVGGYTLNGGTVVSSTSQLPGGTYNVSAHYAGDSIYAPSNSNPVQIQVSAENSATTLSGVFTRDAFGRCTVPFSGGAFGSLVCVQADVTGTSGQGTPTGTVTFSDTFGPIPISNGATIGLNSQANTSARTIGFDAGTHTISATYSGDTSFSSSSAAQPVTFTIQPGFYLVMDSPPVITVTAPGLSGGTIFVVVPSSGFTSAVTFSCAGLPAESTCSFTPSSITGNAQTTVTVATVAPHTTQRMDQRTYYFAQWFASGGLALAGFFFLGTTKKRRCAVPPLLLVLTCLIAFPSCGGGGGGGSKHTQDPGTPTGNYSVSVIASGAGVTQTLNYILVVE